jgi:hypothetical protein
MAHRRGMRTRSWLSLTAQERQLRSAFLSGEEVDFGLETASPAQGAADRGERATVPAALLVELLTRPVDVRRAARAALRLSGAKISGKLDLAGAQITAPMAFDRCWFAEPPDLTRASAANVRMRRCHLPGLTAQLIELRGDLDCEECEFVGPVVLRHGRIGGTVSFDGGQLHHPGQVALNADGVTVQGTVAIRNLTCHGGIRMCTASIGGAVALGGTTLDNADGSALTMDSTYANEVWMTWAVAPRGVVSLINSRVSRLSDNPATWPEQLCLRGLTYETIEGRAAAMPVSVAERLRWLRRDPRGFSPQPYEQLAAYYRRTGHDVEARRVLLAKQRERRRTLAWSGRFAGWLQDILVGYGYRNWLAVGWFLAFWIMGAALFTVHRPQPLLPGGTHEYNAAVYALDLLLPVVDLGQERAWSLAGQAQYAGYALSLAGWTLTAAIVAGLTRLFNRS